MHAHPTARGGKLENLLQHVLHVDVRHSLLYFLQVLHQLRTN